VIQVVGRGGARVLPRQVATDVPAPTLGGATKAAAPRKTKKLLIGVRACSLSPSDYRMLSGDCALVKTTRVPFVPGGDIAGVVLESESDEFATGDAVIATWGPFFGEGGLAERAAVDATLAAPFFPSDRLGFVEAAALANSAPRALVAVEQFVRAGDRVLVLGGSGGMGTMLVQLAKRAGASRVVAKKDRRGAPALLRR